MTADYWADPKRSALMSLALSDHMGDVNDTIPFICQLLGEEPPTWSDERERFVFAFEELEDGE